MKIVPGADKKLHPTGDSYRGHIPAPETGRRPAGFEEAVCLLKAYNYRVAGLERTDKCD
jgi:hypothetical protein